MKYNIFLIIAVCCQLYSQARAEQFSQIKKEIVHEIRELPMSGPAYVFMYSEEGQRKYINIIPDGIDGVNLRIFDCDTSTNAVESSFSYGSQMLYQGFLCMLRFRQNAPECFDENINMPSKYCLSVYMDKNRNFSGWSVCRAPFDIYSQKDILQMRAMFCLMLMSGAKYQ